MPEGRTFPYLISQFANLGTVGSLGTVAASGATLTVTKALHAGRVIAFGALTGTTCTLPASVGNGDVYTFIVKLAATSFANIVKVANGTDVMAGSVYLQQDTDSAGTMKMWLAAATDDTISLAGIATSGGIIGARIQCIDYAAGFWSCLVLGSSGGGSEATCFTNGVS